jgi:hypothetical protein
MNKTKTPTLPWSDIFFANLVAYLPAENFAVSVQHLFSRKEPAHRMKSITIATTIPNPKQIRISRGTRVRTFLRVTAPPKLALTRHHMFSHRSPSLRPSIPNPASKLDITCTRHDDRSIQTLGTLHNASYFRS